MLIAISGTIGVGKSTLCQKLSQHTGYDIAHEPVTDNPYLSDFYMFPDMWAFHNQIFILSTLYSYHRTAPVENKVLLLDRSFYEGKIFVEVLREMGCLTEREYDTYNILYQALVASTAPLDLILYLRISPEEALERIEKRGRESEKAVTLDYLEKLGRAYDNWVQDMSDRGTLVKVLNWTEFGDFQSALDVIQRVVYQRNPGGLTNEAR